MTPPKAPHSLQRLWEQAPPATSVFSPGRVTGLPATARRFLEHAIAPGKPLASAVRLRMHGEIKLRGWCPFTAEQVLDRERGMIWNANVRMNGLPVLGFDRIVGGAGEMRWKMLGLFPVMAASGPDVTRSAAGRLIAELIWLPSALAHPDVEWRAIDSSRVEAVVSAQGQTAALEIGIGNEGRVESLKLPRWGNPGGGEFAEVPFGGVAEKERTFGGYTIPTRLRVGWFYGTDRFESEGEYVRVTVDGASFR